jgi:surfeit locus 1 family protein
MSTHTESSSSISFRGSWKLALFLAVVFTGMVKLGWWQLNRAEQKQVLSKTRAERLQSQPVAFEALKLRPVGPHWHSSVDKQHELKEQLQWLNVILRGRYLNEQSLLIGGKIFRGELGYELITPFRLESDEVIVLVSRGWVAFDEGEFSVQRLIDGTEHALKPYAINGTIHVPILSKFQASKNYVSDVSDVSKVNKVRPLKLRSLDLHSISNQFDAPLLAYTIRLNAQESGVFQRHWRDGNVNLGSHRSYALQWFAMSFIVLTILVLSNTNIAAHIRRKQAIRKSSD